MQRFDLRQDNSWILAEKLGSSSAKAALGDLVRRICVTSSNNRVPADLSSLARLARLRASLLNLAQSLGYVFDFFPDLPTHINRSAALRGHGNTIAGSRSDLDDLPLMQLVSQHSE